MRITVSSLFTLWDAGALVQSAHWLRLVERSSEDDKKDPNDGDGVMMVTLEMMMVTLVMMMVTVVMLEVILEDCW